jgi:hypothetical protein
MSYQIYADQLAAIRAKINSMPGRDAWERLNAFVAANPDDPLSASVRKHGADRVIGTLGTGEAGLKDPNRVGAHEWISTASDVLGIKDYDQQKAEEKAKAAGPTQEDQERAALTKWITDFTTEMSRDVGPGDPMFDSLQRLGASRASMNVGQSGVRVGRGGLGELAVQQGAMNATQPYVMGRKQMAQQGLGMLDQRERGIEQLRQGAQTLEMNRIALQNQIDMQKYGQEADAAGGVGGTIGGVLGGVVGGVATIATGGAAAPMIPGLIAGGSSLGAGIGQSTVRRPSLRSPRPYGSFGGGGYT